MIFLNLSIKVLKKIDYLPKISIFQIIKIKLKNKDE